MANFNISAAVVYQLGEELVSDEITALMELVKNAYDADADYANVIIDTQARTISEDGFLTKPCPNGYISISDNGKGMTLKEINDGWLIISMSHKRTMKAKGETTDRGRTPMGDKGLGRLSTQRLGDSLDMITAKEQVDKKGAKIKTLVSFSWQDFHSEKLLTDVVVNLEDVPNPEREKGTKLFITDLRNPHVWDRERIAIQNKLSQLISPFSEARAFQVYLTINGEEIELDSIAKRIRESASSSYKFNYLSRRTLTVSGSIKLNKLNPSGSPKDDYHRIVGQDEGKEFFNYLTNPASKFHLPNIEYQAEEGWFISFSQNIDIPGMDELEYHEFLGTSELADPGSFMGEIDEFKLRPDEALDSIFDKASEYKEFVKRQVGIRIFRDGFGIRPYGYQGQDWLGLSSNQTSGASFYGLRPNNVIGFVSLRGDVNGVLKEKTDREGFVENDYSKNFFTLLEVVRDRINSFIETVRRGYLAYKEIRDNDELGFESQSYEQSLELIETTSKEATKVGKQIESLAASVEEAEEVVAQVSEILHDNPDSEAALILSPMLAALKENLANANRITESTKSIIPKIQRLTNTAKILGPRFEQLKDQLGEFAELASLGLVAESLTHELSNISNRIDLHTKNAEVASSKNYNKDFATYIEYIRSSVGFIRKQINHLAPSLKYVREKQEKVSIKGFVNDFAKFYRQNEPEIAFLLSEQFDDFSIKANKGKLTQILDNLVLNSIYWLKEHKKKNPEEQSKVWFAAKGSTLFVWDNGLGIDPTVEYSLFQSFITTKAKSAGRGLGLFIVSQLLDTLDADIHLLPERNQHSRRFKFAIDLKKSTQND